MSDTNRNQEDYVKPDQWLTYGSNDKPIPKWKKPSADVPPVSPCRPEGRHFQEPTKRWEMPKAAPESPRQPIRRLHQDWLGVASPSTTSTSSSSPPLYSSSHSATTRSSPPQQIKIRGAASTKENPFFKNFGGL